MRIQGTAVRTGVVLVLSAMVGFGVLVLAVVGTVVALDVLDVVSNGGSLRPAVGVGTAALLGSFFTARAVLARWVPRAQIDVVLPLLSIVSSGVDGECLVIACSAPDHFGRITFRTAHRDTLLRQIEIAKGG